MTCIHTYTELTPLKNPNIVQVSGMNFVRKCAPVVTNKSHVHTHTYTHTHVHTHTHTHTYTHTHQ